MKLSSNTLPFLCRAAFMCAHTVALLLSTMLIFPLLHAREATEWDVTYWYNANSDELPRVLLIGDSICNGYRSDVLQRLAGVAYLSSWATSKCVTDPTYLKRLAFILEEYPYAAIHFNNGLHSLTTDPGEWESALRAAVALIKEKSPDTPLIWVSLTPLKNRKRADQIERLNAIGKQVAAENGMGINDLFALMNPLDRETHWTDTFHFNAEAKALQAAQVAAMLLHALEADPATAEAAKESLKAASTETGPEGALR